MIDGCTAPTPEGWKVSVALEELRIPHVVHAAVACGGDRAVSGAGEIRVYVADKTGQPMPPDASGRANVARWLALNMDDADVQPRARNAKHRSTVPRPFEPAQQVKLVESILVRWSGPRFCSAGCFPPPLLV